MRLDKIVDLVNQKLAGARAEADAFDGGDYSAWCRRRNASIEKLQAELTDEAGAKFSKGSGDGHRVRLAGISATSTIGWESALGNWLQSAERRLDPINLAGSGPMPIAQREG